MTVAMHCANVRVRYGGIEVLHGVGMTVPFGKVTALVGPNGAGKTALLAWCAAAPTTATSTDGQLVLAQQAPPEAAPQDATPQDATTWSATRRATSGVRLVPSGMNVFSSLTVADNLRAGAHTSAGARSGRSASPGPKALDLFPELRPLLHRRAGTLSGGQQQLLAIAAALGGEWRVLLVDEPVQGIAPALADRVYDALAAAVAIDRAVLVADPVTSRAARVADFVWRLERGRVTFAGEPAELAPHEGTRRAACPPQMDTGP